LSGESPGPAPPVPPVPPAPPAPDDIELVDTGLARERTRLAWTRSAISFAAIGVAILKARPLIGAPLLVVGVVVWAIGRMPRWPGPHFGDVEAVARRRTAFVTAAIIVVALAALAIALLGHSPHGLKL
jgi:uncharacterized membrane protein YidH (DUF202 family)